MKCVLNKVLHLVVSEPKFRRFYKMILKLFVNDFEIFLTCIAFAYKADVTLTRILMVLIGKHEWNKSP